ncbi:MAG: sporulation protein YqfD [Clostridiales bacterium]|nr:sporulation protein YqfD [Clostridiales bacterium]
MTDLTQICIISTAESALSKLKRGQITVYNCKKEGAKFLFFVSDKDIEKVFAIFAKPCYNIKVVKKSAKKRAFDFMKLRAGLLLGAAAFIVLAALSDFYMLKIEVDGSGSYLEPEVRRIIQSEGAGEFKLYSSFNTARATGRILALPQVTFCNISKKGSVLTVDVQVDTEHSGALLNSSLISDRAGKVLRLVAICGTEAVKEGDSVEKGSTLIFPYTLAGEEKVDCIAAGYAEIECRATSQYFAETESEQSLKEAYASLLLEDGEIIEKTHYVTPTADGVIYVLNYTYLHKISINLT